MVPAQSHTHQNESCGVRGQGHCQHLYQIGVIQLAVGMKQWVGSRREWGRERGRWWKLYCSILHEWMHHTKVTRLHTKVLNIYFLTH